MNKIRDEVMRKATKHAKQCIDYSDLKFFIENELPEMFGKEYSTCDFEKLAARSALSTLIYRAKLEVETGYDTGGKMAKISEYKSDAIKIANILGINADRITKKFDNIQTNVHLREKGREIYNGLPEEICKNSSLVKYMVDMIAGKGDVMEFLKETVPGEAHLMPTIQIEMLTGFEEAVREKGDLETADYVSIQIAGLDK